MWPNPQFPADLVTFTEEILNGKLHFFVQCLSDDICQLIKEAISKGIDFERQIPAKSLIKPLHL